MKQLWWLLKTAIHSFVGVKKFIFVFNPHSLPPASWSELKKKRSQELKKLPVISQVKFKSQFVLSCPGKLTINELISNVGIELL